MSDQGTSSAPGGITRFEPPDQQTLLQVAESAMEGMALVNPAGNIIYLNQAFAKMHGYEAEELVGQAVSTCYSAGAPQDYGEFSGETIHIRQDASTFPCRERRLFYKDATGQQPGIILAVHDISERKRIENEFWESEFKYREIVQNANSIIMRWDPDGRITFFNQYARQFFGYSEDEIVGKNLMGTIVPVTDSAGHALSKMIEEIKHRPERYETNENENVKKNGERVWVAWTNKAIVDPTGAMVGVLSIGNDITERKRMQQDLLQAQKLESLGVLIAGISHDYNNILTEVFGNIGAAKLYLDLTQKVFERISEAEKASLRAKKLTAELHSFTKGRSPVTKTSSIAALIEDSASFVCRGSNVVCDFTVHDDLWPVRFDEEMLLHVFTTLIINAQQAMPKGGLINIRVENVHVSVEDDLPMRPGKYVKIVVEDHGVGISPEVLPKIFDPYFTTKQEHTGLGLATAYSMVRRHKGHISVVSNPGQSTTFGVYLPVARAGKSKSLPEGNLPLEKTRVLVMDGDEVSRVAAREVLTVLNCEAAFAHAIAEGLDIFQKSLELGQPFDMVLGDSTVLESIGGEEAIRTMFRLQPDLKAVVCSDLREELTDAQRGLGFTEVLNKPYTMQEVSVVINRLFGK